MKTIHSTVRLLLLAAAIAALPACSTETKVVEVTRHSYYRPAPAPAGPGEFRVVNQYDESRR